MLLFGGDFGFSFQILVLILVILVLILGSFLAVGDFDLVVGRVEIGIVVEWSGA